MSFEPNNDGNIRLPPRPRNLSVPTITIESHTHIDDKQYITVREQEHQLRKQGHTCIQYLERLPPAIKWCEQNICVNKRYRQADIVFSDDTNFWKPEPVPIE